MLLAGIIRHTSGFTWGYNQLLFFDEKLPNHQHTRLYLMICPVIAGVSGATVGGMATDYLRKTPRFSGPKGTIKRNLKYILGLIIIKPSIFEILKFYFDQK